jgi:hypothetical protein
MTDNQKYRELLDGFFEGTLSSSEESTLMNRLATDADLKSEFELQQDIINTIRETRKMELKGRLENIPIRWYHNVSNSWKVAATATVITVSTLTALYFIDLQDEFRNKIDLAQHEIILNELYPDGADIPQKPAVDVPEEVVGVRSMKHEITTEHREEANALETTASTRSHTIDVVVPDVIEDFEEVDNIEPESISSGDINTMKPSREDLHSSVEINTVLHKKFNFHYDFSAGTLTLYGNFEDVPYEILEINSATGKRFYLNYKDQFYNIINTDNVMPLQPVTNEALINELKIVKGNK